MTKPHINHAFTETTYALPVVVYEKNTQSILSRGSRILRARTALGSEGRLRPDDTPGNEPGDLN